jgi:Tfp pilus assembly protein PilO
MKLPKNYFENLSAAKYREYLKLLPHAQQEGIKNFITLLLTFAALTFFGIFAINPTLSTIIDLKRQLKDNKFVAEQLQKKYTALSTLQQEYGTLTSQLPIVFDAIPQEPSVFLLSGQIQALAKQSGVTIKELRVFEVEIAGKGKTVIKNPSFSFALQANGSYEKLIGFAHSLSRLNRIVTIESISLNKEVRTAELVLNIRGRAYFKP